MEFKEIKLLNIAGQIQVEKILYACGKNMVEKYEIHQWDYSHTKAMIIVAMCELKNRVFIALNEDKRPIATFQFRICHDVLYFEKIGTMPEFQGQGIAGSILEHMAEIAKENGCSKMACDVYEKNNYAFAYYQKKGFKKCKTISTRKYILFSMERNLQ